MKKAFIIAKKDFFSYFTSPVAYIVIAIYLFLSGYFFWNIVSFFAASEANQYHQLPYNVEMRVLISQMAMILLFISPMITMRLFSEEKKIGTMELLATSPVSFANIAIGKFIAGALFFLVLCILTLHYPITLMSIGNPDIGPLISSYLGFILLGLSFISIGIFSSSVTENQIVSVVICFGILLMLWVIGWAGQGTYGIMERILSSLSIKEHLDNFTKGILDLKDVFYYISIIIAFLALTIKKLEWKRT